MRGKWKKETDHRPRQTKKQTPRVSCLPLTPRLGLLPYSVDRVLCLHFNLAVSSILEVPAWPSLLLALTSTNAMTTTKRRKIKQQQSGGGRRGRQLEFDQQEGGHLMVSLIDDLIGKVLSYVDFYERSKGVRAVNPSAAFDRRFDDNISEGYSEDQERT